MASDDLCQDPETPLVPTLLDKVKSHRFTVDVCVRDKSYDSEVVYAEVESRHAAANRADGRSRVTASSTSVATIARPSTDSGTCAHATRSVRGRGRVSRCGSS